MITVSESPTMIRLSGRSVSNIAQDESGVTLVEYGLAIALAITLGVSAFTVLGGEVSASMNAVGGLMPN